MAEQPVVLGYWGIRGLAQPIRFLLEYLGVPYEEKRYADPAQWNADFESEPMKNHPLCNLPYIKDGDRYIYESGAIPVFLAHRFNRVELLGRDAKEQVLQAQVRGLTQDLMTQFIKVITLPQEEYDEKGLATLKENAGWLLQRLDKFFENKTFSAGDNITLADFQVFEVLETLRHYNQAFLENKPNLLRFHETFSKLPQIEAYLKSPKFLERPFYPPVGRFRWG